MKPWQSKTSGAVAKKKSEGPGSLTVNEHVSGIGFLMKQSPSYWREMGKRRPMVAQFRVPTDEGSSWFVQVDEQGGRATVGLHPAPSVTWESDLEAMDAAFQGKILPGRIRVRGDFEEMRSLFAAIAQTQIPGHS
jgi:hypothetical protein